MNENKNTIYRSIWDTTKAVLRGTKTAVNIQIKRQEISLDDNLILYFEEL